MSTRPSTPAPPPTRPSGRAGPHPDLSSFPAAADASLAPALSWLEDHVNLEAVVAGRGDAPTLERMTELVSLLGTPQVSYPVLHITGTNGKGSTARMLSSLLMAMGLGVGTYTSPDLERVNERLARDLEPIADAEFARILGAVRLAEPFMASPPSRFEILTAAAFTWFADLAVDAAVVEVGLGGLWDATNVADGEVAVVTNVNLDHTEIIGPGLPEIAAEKAGIVKPGCTLVLGETRPELAPMFTEAGARVVWERGRHFGCASAAVAHGGRLLELHTPSARYEDVYLPLHGAHQGDNAACALAAVEAFLGAPMPEAAVRQAFAGVTTPGRMEVVARHPLVLLDGAHNPAGACAAAATLDEEFGAAPRVVLVMGLLKGRDPTEMLSALGPGRLARVVACPPPSPRALPPAEVVAAARSLGVPAEAAPDTETALARAQGATGPEDLVLVAGSLYLVGDARSVLNGPTSTGLWGRRSPSSGPAGGGQQD